MAAWRRSGWTLEIAGWVASGIWHQQDGRMRGVSDSIGQLARDALGTQDRSGWILGLCAGAPGPLLCPGAESRCCSSGWGSSQQTGEGLWPNPHSPGTFPASPTFPKPRLAVTLPGLPDASGAGARHGGDSREPWGQRSGCHLVCPRDWASGRTVSSFLEKRQQLINSGTHVFKVKCDFLE